MASTAGVNLQTLRYYERRGLIAKPERTLGGHRLYPEDTVTMLRVIKAAQRLGFTLQEVADLLDAGRHRHRGPGKEPDGNLLADRAAEKLADVEARIVDLELIAETLRAVIDVGCSDLTACESSHCCPIPFANLTARTDQ